jgi:hypothetical protein
MENHYICYTPKSEALMNAAIAIGEGYGFRRRPGSTWGFDVFQEVGVPTYSILFYKDQLEHGYKVIGYGCAALGDRYAMATSLDDLVAALSAPPTTKQPLAIGGLCLHGRNGAEGASVTLHPNGDVDIGCRSITKLGAEWFIKEYTAYHKETP